MVSSHHINHPLSHQRHILPRAVGAVIVYFYASIFPSNNPKCRLSPTFSSLVLAELLACVIPGIFFFSGVTMKEKTCTVFTLFSDYYFSFADVFIFACVVQKCCCSCMCLSGKSTGRAAGAPETFSGGSGHLRTTTFPGKSGFKPHHRRGHSTGMNHVRRTPRQYDKLIGLVAVSWPQ